MADHIIAPPYLFFLFCWRYLVPSVLLANFHYSFLNDHGGGGQFLNVAVTKGKLIIIYSVQIKLADELWRTIPVLSIVLEEESTAFNSSICCSNRVLSSPSSLVNAVSLNSNPGRRTSAFNKHKFVWFSPRRRTQYHWTRGQPAVHI